MANYGSRLCSPRRFGSIATVFPGYRHRPAMPQHIAIVEDESAIAANYRDALQREGYAVRTCEKDQL